MGEAIDQDRTDRDDPGRAGVDQGRFDWWTASARLGELSGQVAQLHAELVAVTAQVIADDAWRGAGIGSVAQFLEVKAGVDRGTAAKLVRVAGRAGELPEALGLLGQGRLTLDQVAVIARHVPADHSASVAEFAEHATVVQLRRGLSGYFPKPDPPADAGPDPDTADAGGGGSVLRLSDQDGRFGLRYATDDLVAGELIRQALGEAKDALFNAGDTAATLADGLVEVARRSLDQAPAAGRTRYQVLLHLDTDQQTWLHKKGAVPQCLADRYTCDTTITPAWETGGTPVAVGRAKRIVSDKVRVLIEDRDKGCRYPACPATGSLENHHLTHWRNGGTTDPANLVSLCPRHHRDHHNGLYTITGDPTRPGGLKFTNQHGLNLDPARRPPPPANLPPPKWQGPTGQPLHTHQLNFTPNPP